MKTFAEIQQFVDQYEEKLMAIPLQSISNQGGLTIGRTSGYFKFTWEDRATHLLFPLDTNDYPRLGLLENLEVNEYELNSKRLREALLSKSQYYPHTYGWWYSVQSGALCELTLNVSAFSTMHYFGLQSNRQGRLGTGYSVELEALPESIIGLTEILGLPIPWQIDYEATVEKIFADSQLERILESL